ncbi:hypothetical protein H5410_046537 [Solanum commersonii]|uniref:Uncharacterized protein n=1 Tax=Solanum commersonii TaxID=4109 RepID=A0A9J5XEP8_SOLCO|nr:hypothetical protein H5410_046537 [Solanum commersonii]
MGFKFDIIVFVINDSPPSYASNGSRIHHHGLSISLSNRFGTTIQIDPPYPQAIELKTWYS